MKGPKIISAAKAFVVDGQGNFLCLYRSGTHPTHPHWADLPGGLIDEGEMPFEALVREMQEECQIDISYSKFNLIFAESEMPDKFPDTSITRLFYLIKIDDIKPEVLISWEHEKYEWLKYEEIFGKKFEEFVERAKEYIFKNKISLNV